MRSLPSRLSRAATVAVALALLGTATTSPTAATAAPAPRAVPHAAPLDPPSPELPGLPKISVALTQVPVSSADLTSAAARYESAAGAHVDARSRRTDLDMRLTELRSRVTALNATRASGQARAATAAARLAELDTAIQQLAVEAFVTGDEEARLDSALVDEEPSITDADLRDLYSGLSMEVLLAEQAAFQRQLHEAEDRASGAEAELADVEADLATLAAERPSRESTEVAAASRVADERVAYEEARVLAQVDGVEFPLVALDAYYRAADLANEEFPTCGVQWWAIAGISRVEGHHGTYGGASLEANGDTSKRIIGIQLNGARSTAVVGDSDGGTLDGDATFDRAVGPMQFIPQTWRRYAADGNDDGEISPFNLYDATLAAANYLCTASSGLDGDGGLRSAYFSYNHSLAYVDAVLGHARFYERSVAVPGPGG